MEGLNSNEIDKGGSCAPPRICSVCDKVKDKFSGLTCIQCRRWFSLNIDQLYFGPNCLMCLTKPDQGCKLNTCSPCRLQKFLLITKYLDSDDITHTCFYCEGKTIMKAAGGFHKCSICRKISYEEVSRKPGNKRTSLDNCTCLPGASSKCKCCLLKKMQQHQEMLKNQEVQFLVNGSCTGDSQKKLCPMSAPQADYSPPSLTKISLTAIPSEFRKSARTQLACYDCVVQLQKICLDKILVHENSFQSNSLGPQFYHPSSTFQDDDDRLPVPCHPMRSLDVSSKHHSKKHKKRRKQDSYSHDRYNIPEGFQSSSQSNAPYNVVNVTDTRLVLQKPASSRGGSVSGISPLSPSRAFPSTSSASIGAGFPLLKKSKVSIPEETSNSPQPRLAPLFSPEGFRSPVLAVRGNRGRRGRVFRAAASQPLAQPSHSPSQSSHPPSQPGQPLFPANLTRDAATQTDESTRMQNELEEMKSRIRELENMIAASNNVNKPSTSNQFRIQGAPNAGSPQRVVQPRPNLVTEEEIQGSPFSDTSSTSEKNRILSIRLSRLSVNELYKYGIESPSPTPRSVKRARLDPALIEPQNSQNVAKASQPSSDKPPPSETIERSSIQSKLTDLFGSDLELDYDDYSEKPKDQVKENLNIAGITAINDELGPSGQETSKSKDDKDRKESKIDLNKKKKHHDNEKKRIAEKEKRPTEKRSSEKKSEEKNGKSSKDRETERRKLVKTKDKKHSSGNDRGKTEGKDGASKKKTFRIPRLPPARPEENEQVPKAVLPSPTVGLPPLLLFEPGPFTKETELPRKERVRAPEPVEKLPMVPEVEKSMTTSSSIDNCKPITAMFLKKRERTKSVSFAETALVRNISPRPQHLCSSTYQSSMDSIREDLLYVPESTVQPNVDHSKPPINAFDLPSTTNGSIKSLIGRGPVVERAKRGGISAGMRRFYRSPSPSEDDSSEGETPIPSREKPDETERESGIKDNSFESVFENSRDSERDTENVNGVSEKVPTVDSSARDLNETEEEDHCGNEVEFEYSDDEIESPIHAKSAEPSVPVQKKKGSPEPEEEIASEVVFDHDDDSSSPSEPQVPCPQANVQNYANDQSIDESDEDCLEINLGEEETFEEFSSFQEPEEPVKTFKNRSSNLQPSTHCSSQVVTGVRSDPRLSIMNQNSVATVAVRIPEVKTNQNSDAPASVNQMNHMYANYVPDKHPCFAFIRTGICRSTAENKGCTFYHDVDLNMLAASLRYFCNTNKIVNAKAIVDNISKKESPFFRFLPTEWGREMVKMLILRLFKDEASFDDALRFFTNQSIPLDVELCAKAINLSPPTKIVASMLIKIYQRLVNENVLVNSTCWNQITYVFAFVEEWKHCLNAIEAAIRLYPLFIPSDKVLKFVFTDALNSETRLCEVCQIFLLFDKNILSRLESTDAEKVLAALKKFDRKELFESYSKIFVKPTSHLISPHLPVPNGIPYGQHSLMVQQQPVLGAAVRPHVPVESPIEVQQRLDLLFKKQHFEPIASLLQKCYSGSPKDPFLFQLFNLIKDHKPLNFPSPGEIVAKIVGAGLYAMPVTMPDPHLQVLMDLSFGVLSYLRELGNYEDAFNIIFANDLLGVPIFDYFRKRFLSLRMSLFLAQTCLEKEKLVYTCWFLTEFHKGAEHQQIDTDLVDQELDIFNRVMVLVDSMKMEREEGEEGEEGDEETGDIAEALATYHEEAQKNSSRFNQMRGIV